MPITPPHNPPLPSRSEFPCFDDDLSGTAAAVLAGVLASLPKIGGKLADQTFLFSGGEEGAMVMSRRGEEAIGRGG